MMLNIEDADAIFFDLDDTLYDQLLPFQFAIQNSKLDIQPEQVEWLFKRVRYYSDKLWKRYTKGEISLEFVRIDRLTSALSEFHIFITPEQALEIQAQYEYEQTAITPFPHVISFIKELQDKNKVVGMITNGPVSHQMNKIKALQLDRIISKELIFISDGIGLTKPDHRVFEYVQDQVNIRPENCYYIGDNWENDIVPPIIAGWKSIWFNYRNREPQTEHTPIHIIKGYEACTVQF